MAAPEKRPTESRMLVAGEENSSLEYTTEPCVRSEDKLLRNAAERFESCRCRDLSASGDPCSTASRACRLGRRPLSAGGSQRDALSA